MFKVAIGMVEVGRLLSEVQKWEKRQQVYEGLKRQIRQFYCESIELQHTIGRQR